MRAEPRQIDDAEILLALRPYGFSPTAEQCAKIRSYLVVLLRWNRSMSLTTVTDPPEIIGRHFGESIFASKLLPVENCRLVDIGTGAGFPGLALKVVCPSIQLELIESNKKKCAFLSEVVRVLDLSEVKILPARFEEIRSETVKANVITCRAVGDFKEVLRWSANALTERGHVVLWLGSEDSTRISSYPNWIWQPPVKLPQSQRRFILIGRAAHSAVHPL